MKHCAKHRRKNEAECRAGSRHKDSL
jgi:hypothetical protein